MSYISLKFCLLVVGTVLLYFIAPKKYRWTVLLVASLLFYFLNSKLLVLFPAAATLVAYIAARAIDKNNQKFKLAKKTLESKEERKAMKASVKKKNRAILTVSVAAVLSFLIVLKYTPFFVETIKSIAVFFKAEKNISVPKLLMPLGISYYTLSLIAYITDVYKGVVQAEKNYFQLLAFSCYFPHIVEGPIASYKNLAPQIKEGQDFSYDRLINSLLLLLYGLMKKLVLADRLAIIANEVFDNPGVYGGVVSVLGIVSYTGYIYADFSGCIDIVSGVSEIFGIKLAENFRQPFFSRSIQEFWRRWHITLGEWLKNYIFYPISLSASVKKLTEKLRLKKHISEYYAMTVPMLWSLLFVWLGNGFWHGASWKYVVYGLYYYVIIMLGQLLEPLFQKLPFDREKKPYKVFQIARTFVLVCLGLTLFRANSISDMFKILGSLSHMTAFSEFYGAINSNISILDFAVIAFACAVIFFVSFNKERENDLRDKLSGKPVARWLVCTAFVIFILLLGVYGSHYTTQPFIYGQF